MTKSAPMIQAMSVARLALRALLFIAEQFSAMTDAVILLIETRFQTGDDRPIGRFVEIGLRMIDTGEFVERAA